MRNFFCESTRTSKAQQATGYSIRSQPNCNGSKLSWVGFLGHSHFHRMDERFCFIAHRISMWSTSRRGWPRHSRPAKMSKPFTTDARFGVLILQKSHTLRRMSQRFLYARSFSLPIRVIRPFARIDLLESAKRSPHCEWVWSMPQGVKPNGSIYPLNRVISIFKPSIGRTILTNC